MKKHIFANIFLIMILSIFLSGCSLLEGLFLTTDEVPTYSFSGYVYADGEPLANATVNCGKITSTDEQGYYSFDGVKNAVGVSVSMNGYLFDSKPVVVNGASSSVNFDGYKLFNKRGVVKNGDEVVEGATIIVESASGTYPVVSNGNGEFYLPNLAGNVKLTATKDNYTFFTQSFSISKEDDVVILGKADISGRIMADADALASDFELTCDGSAVSINDDLTFDILGVSSGSELLLASEKFYIVTPKTYVSSTNAIDFACYKYYDITGEVKCGDVLLDGVSVSAGRANAVTNNGKFEIKNYYGETSILCSLDGYTFDSVTVSHANASANINSTFNIGLKVGLDVGNSYKGISVKVDGQTFDKCTNDGKFTLTNVRYGQVVSVLTSDYHVPAPITISNRKDLSISLKRLYSIDILAQCGENALDGATYQIGEISGSVDASGTTISGLYGSHVVTISKDGYVFLNSYEVNCYATTVHANGYKLYNIGGNVYSGDISLKDAKITLGENTYYSNDLGAFEISNVYGTLNLTIEKNGYNAKSVSVDIDNNDLDVELDYDISGIIKCGDFAVSNVKVSAGDIVAYSDSIGTFGLKGLKGTSKITFEKENYSFDSVNVNSKENLNVSTSYQIFGNVNTREGVISGLEILLVSKKDGSTQSTTTDSDGNYSFEGLTDSYILYYGQSSINLRPKQYEVKAGGICDFSNTGFTFGGTVKCGDSVLEGVTLTVGSVSAITDENGVYSFPLVTASGALTLSKDGYTFENNGMDIDDTFDGKTDVDFSATYKVVINAKSGSTLLNGVVVKVNGEYVGTTNNGILEVLGLVGENSIALSLNNYKFNGASTVNTYVVLEYTACFDVVATICTGDVLVAGVSSSINGTSVNAVSGADGKIMIPNVKLGDVITFAKENYTIESKTVGGYMEEFSVSSSYTISGVVVNCNKAIEGAEVSIVGGRTTLTNSLGGFTFSGVVGKVTLSFRKDGFDFENIEVSNADKLNIASNYTISGMVKLSSGSGIGGVEVYVNGDKKTNTLVSGAFSISRLNTSVVLTFVKNGYTFYSSVGDIDNENPMTSMEINEPTNSIEVYGTYEISGYVKSGSVAIGNATVSVGSNSNTTTANGYYTISGLSGDNLEVSVKVDGYDCVAVYKRVSGYNTSVSFDLTYSVSLRVNGDSTTINVAVAGESPLSKTTYTANAKDKTIQLTSLKGVNTITISKDGYIVSPSEINNITNEMGIDITVKMLYNISGTVKVADGTVVPNATIIVGDKEYRADSDGKYSITGLTGSNILSAKLPFNGSKDDDITKSYGQVSKSGEYNIEFSTKAFYLGLLNNAYYNLDNGNGYQIVGTGSVKAVADIMSIKSDSTVDVHYKQDANGIKIFENKNNGGVAAGVDPNVSLLTLYNTKTGEVRGQFISGKDNVLDTSVNYTDTWDNWNNGSQIGTVEAYATKFGVDMTGFSPYIINLDTINSATKVSDTGDYIFKLDMNTTTSVTNYNILMGVMCDKKDMKGFNSIVLTITISKTGYIKEMKMAEKYTVVTNSNASVPGASAEVTGNITYTFYTNQNNRIGAIDTTSPKTAVTNIRTLETYDNVDALINTINTTTQKVDLIVCKKEEIL